MYSDDLADRICAALATGISLNRLCKQDDMPAPATVFRWLGENPGFRDKYTLAKQESADAMAEDILDIADDQTQDELLTEEGYRGNPVAVNRARLRVDTRKFLMAKMKPKKYGDRINHDHGGQVGVVEIDFTGLDESDGDGDQVS